MEATRTFETSVDIQLTRQYIPEDSELRLNTCSFTTNETEIKIILLLLCLYSPWKDLGRLTHGTFLILLGKLVKLVCTSDQPVAKASTYTLQQRNTKTNIHDFSKIRT
jgi:hypothetical protein